MSDGKIIQLGAPSYGTAELKLKQQGLQFDFLCTGNPEALYKMLLEGMRYDANCAKIVMSAVVAFAHEKSIRHDELIKHSYLQKL